ncbi:unnamed protein product [Urochloa humidicola]
MKQAADRLRDAGQPVSEPNLVLNLLRGINPKFSTTADFIAATADMTFTKAVDHLSLKELRLANEDKVASSTALVASASSTGCGTACRSASAYSGAQPAQQQRRPKKKRNNGGGGGGQQQQHPGGQ